MGDDDLSEPQIQYARASDGVRIAYWQTGDGPPLLHMPPLPLSNLQLEWQNDACRGLYLDLARRRRLIRYDCRGAGLSDRDALDFSLEAQVRDLTAVADQLKLERFALLGFTHTGPAAIAFAAAHPERVTHLILWCSYARATDYNRAPRVEAARSLIPRNWELYTEMEGYRFSEWEGGEQARWYTRYIRESTSQQALEAAFAAISRLDATGLLPQVRAPTLVLHRQDSRLLSVDVARGLAAGIPGGRLVLVDGMWIAHFLGDAGAVVSAIEAFLGDSSGDAPDRASRQHEDVVASTGLTPKEIQVLRLIAHGLTTTEISLELQLSARTVGRHITNIYTKVGVESRAEATAFAIRNGVVRSD